MMMFKFLVSDQNIIPSYYLVNLFNDIIAQIRLGKKDASDYNLEQLNQILKFCRSSDLYRCVGNKV